ncbi:MULTISPECIES: SRPBCC family protein [unclassified Rhizobium]|uniref:SRPBCC family protein n=1 Tax=unclassified Rhizobium TaxID=2613769 RepID=UPI001ADD60A9|nr:MULTISPECIES: SRPBCC family protein [unclassified Rhizobium]MBO9097680.1 SRPBCC family protein [Rhizobium sp. L58/93]MBO9133538.1 SRPBCC family protein [Rhizobium sp. B209b/85]MBO9167829.1 SRPBCC family protein [Rhizobium sp. L245/93]MBO9183874.1 SRPBCC family protein [Rhizobium sp. E27B/91]QXZ84117.1 SRPBCC family protein [Rhizobium sp. K1/93]
MSKSYVAVYTATIGTSPERIWAVVRDFATVASWNPIACESRLVGKGERELITADGTLVRERMIKCDDDARHLTYQMVTFPIPVTEQTNQILVVAGKSEDETNIRFEASFIPADGVDSNVIQGINLSAFASASEGLARHLGVALVRASL